MADDALTRKEAEMESLTAIEEFVKRLKAEPIPMLMFCPRCFKQHIDAPNGEWTNPPHATHTCQFCGLLWRPSNENTTGVKEIQQLEPKHAERIAASFPLSLESVREEALEEAAKACDAKAEEYSFRSSWNLVRYVRVWLARENAAAIRALQHAPARVAEDGEDRPEIARALLQKFNKLGYMETASRIVDFVLDRSAKWES